MDPRKLRKKLRPLRVIGLPAGVVGICVAYLFDKDALEIAKNILSKKLWKGCTQEEKKKLFKFIHVQVSLLTLPRVLHYNTAPSFDRLVAERLATFATASTPRLSLIILPSAGQRSLAAKWLQLNSETTQSITICRLCPDIRYRGECGCPFFDRGRGLFLESKEVKALVKPAIAFMSIKTAKLFSHRDGVRFLRDKNCCVVIGKLEFISSHAQHEFYHYPPKTPKIV